MAVEFSDNLTSAKQATIAIVGGGIAGVTLAAGILRHAPHVSITLYEAASAFGEIGAGVGFGPNAVTAMTLIDPAIREGFERRATYNQTEAKKHDVFDLRVGDERLDTIKWNTARGSQPGGGELGLGPPFHTIAAPWGQASVHRAHFLDEVVKLLPKGVAQHRKRLVDIEPSASGGVLLRFEDGTSAEHDAIIGCDGIKSNTRLLLLGEKDPAARAVFSGKYAYRGLVPMDQAVKLLGDELARNGQMYVGYHGHIVTFPIEKGRTMNVVAFSSKETWDQEAWVVSTSKEALYADFEGWGPTVHSVLQLMQKTDIWALFDHPPASSYSKGRICLLGDAAHASTPHQGAGAAMALEDAYVMSRLLATVSSTEDIEAAFQSFDTIRRPRTQKLVKTSRESGKLFDFELEGVGDNIDLIREDAKQRFHWIWHDNWAGEVDKAKRVPGGS
ncbi:mannitol 1-phosphate dehydrogenase 2 [Cadophora sp. MPI-SDFR-AT-0126]|nr:mannitol 1-phosphate dehydrogenase 2 [Leotiomycetes sp. MPI-SDFR-AT-0126]